MGACKKPALLNFKRRDFTIAPESGQALSLDYFHLYRMLVHQTIILHYLILINQKYRKEKGDEADDNRTEKCRPEPVDVKTNPEQLGRNP